MLNIFSDHLKSSLWKYAFTSAFQFFVTTQEQEMPQSLNRLAGVSTITTYNSTFNLFSTGVHEKWNKYGCVGLPISEIY